MFESFSTNVSIAGEDLLRVFYRLFYLQFCDSSEKTLCSKGFTSNLRDIFTKVYPLFVLSCKPKQESVFQQVGGLVTRNISVYCL